MQSSNNNGIITNPPVLALYSITRRWKRLPYHKHTSRHMRHSSCFIQTFLGTIWLDLFAILFGFLSLTAMAIVQNSIYLIEANLHARNYSYLDNNWFKSVPCCCASWVGYVRWKVEHLQLLSLLRFSFSVYLGLCKMENRLNCFIGHYPDAEGKVQMT